MQSTADLVGEGVVLLENGLGCTLPESKQESGLSVGARGLSTRDIEDTFTWPPAALARAGVREIIRHGRWCARLWRQSVRHHRTRLWRQSVIEAQPDRLREVDGIGPVRAGPSGVPPQCTDFSRADPG